MFGLIYLLFKIMWWLMLTTIWLVVAVFVLLVAMIASATGNRSAGRNVMRSLNWSRMF
jgi:ABC-type multidrug transport system fused ATPase/permease subunit